MSMAQPNVQISNRRLLIAPAIEISWKDCTDPYVFQLDDHERELLGGCEFLSKKWIMDRLKYEWKPMRGLVTIHVLLGDFAGKPTHKRSKMFVLPNGEETISTELANLSDLHGIVALYSGSLWLARTSDPSELNIDDEVMGRIQEIIRIASMEEEERLLEEEQRKIMRNSLYGFGGSGK